jgi:uncharacterized membrane protein
MIGIAMILPSRFFFPCLVGSVAGMMADSLLGATLERRGYLGNNLVNLFSTTAAALISFLMIRG